MILVILIAAVVLLPLGALALVLPETEKFSSRF